MNKISYHFDERLWVNPYLYFGRVEIDEEEVRRFFCDPFYLYISYNKSQETFVRIYLENSVEYNRILTITSFYLENKEKLESIGLTNAEFWIKWYGNQGNMSLSPEEVQALAATGLEIPMDYVFWDEREDPSINPLTGKKIGPPDKVGD